MSYYQQSNEYKKKLNKIQKEVDQAIERIFKNGEFQRYLEVVARFPKYSLHNVMMIVSQKPNATLVMGYKAWQELGRQVQKGEKAIKIFAPIFEKKLQPKIDPETNEPIRDEKGRTVMEKKEILKGFRFVNVFDVSQTQGKELFDIRKLIREDLKESERIQSLYKHFLAHLNKNRIEVKEEVLDDPNIKGYYDRAKHLIRINASVENTSLKFKTLIHEYAHAQLHHKDSDMQKLPRGHKEAQAEAVAFIVSKYYGLDTEPYSAGYIATWAKDIQLAKQAMKEIQHVAQGVIQEIDELMKDRIKELRQMHESSKDQDKNNKNEKDKEIELER